jgi:hypothetical protein
MAYRSQATNMIGIVEETARRYPGPFERCHRPDEYGEGAWHFVMILAAILHYQYDQRWGLNAKRGNPNDRSMDAVSWREPASPAGGVDIFDVVSSAGETDPRKPQPAPAWIDQTQATVDAGTRGGFIKPPTLAEILAEIGEKPTDPVEPGEPDPVDPGRNPPPPPTDNVAALLQRVLSELSDIKAQVAASNGAAGQFATQLNDLGERQELLFGNQTRRLFGLLDENGITHPGVAEEAVRLIWERAARDPMKAKVDLPGGLGGILRPRGGADDQ